MYPTANSLDFGKWRCRLKRMMSTPAGPHWGQFHTVFDIKNPCAFDICVYDESMEQIELD